VAVRTDVWVFLIFVIVPGSRGRERLAAVYNRYTLSSPFCPAFPPRYSLSHFPNELLSRTSSLSQTNSLHNHHNHHHSSSSSTIRTLYSYSRQLPAIFVAMFCHYCCRWLQAPLPLVFGNTISFKFVSSHPHVFPKLHTYAYYLHLPFPPAYLNDRTNKRESALPPLRLGLQRWIRIMYNTAPRVTSRRDCTLVQ